MMNNPKDMTGEQLVEYARRLFEDATQGEWNLYKDRSGVNAVWHGSKKPNNCSANLFVQDHATQKDCELAVAMHKHLPDLLDSYEKMQGDFKSIPT